MGARLLDKVPLGTPCKLARLASAPVLQVSAAVPARSDCEYKRL